MDRLGKVLFPWATRGIRTCFRASLCPCFRFLLIPLGYYLLTRGHFFWGVGVALVYVVSIKSLEEAGLKLKKRISHADTGAKSEQAFAEALQELPDDYYVFHDLEFPGFNIDHVVLGPNSA